MNLLRTRYPSVWRGCSRRFQLGIILFGSMGLSSTHGSQLPDYRPSQPIAGSLSSAGSDAMDTLMKRWAAILSHAHPKIIVSVRKGTPASGLAALADGSAELSPSGRSAWAAEIHEFEARAGHRPGVVTVARCTYESREWPHPHAIFVHQDNPLAKISLTEVDAIFSKTRNRGAPAEITTWGQLGLTGEWAAHPIRFYGVDRTKGPGQFFRERALADGEFKEGMDEAPGEDQVLPKLGLDKFGIAFTGLPFEVPGVKRLALAEDIGGRYSNGSYEEVMGGEYPLSRDIYIYFDRAPGTPLDPRVKEFLRVALSRQGQEAALSEGYMPLPADRIAAELAILE